MLLTVLMMVLAYMVPVQAQQKFCEPTAEGEPITLTCDLDTSACPPTNALKWENLAAPNRVIATCGESGCDGQYIRENYFSATYTNRSSTLTIHNVSRTDPFNMELQEWYCVNTCFGQKVSAACNYIRIYANPEDITCKVTEGTLSVTITCTTSKVYPQAKCSFFTSKNGNAFSRIVNGEYSRSSLFYANATYYSTRCWVGLPMSDVGEGTHSFRAIVYPRIDGGENVVNGPISVDTNVTLSFPEISYTCYPSIVEGFFPGKYTTCTQGVVSHGKPKGRAQWFYGNQEVGVGNALTVTYDKNNPEPVYTCEAVSAIGRKLGFTLRPKFAYISITTDSNQTTFDIGDRLTLTCKTQGNLDPTLLTLTRKRTNEILASVQPASEVVHTFDALRCTDTGVYICSAPNSPAPAEEIILAVRCPSQFSSPDDSTKSFQSAVGDTLFTTVEVYGYPEPNTLSLKKINDSIELTLSSRHEVKYSPATSPFGFVSVSITDIMNSDFTGYTLTIDNGVRDVLIYKFSLKKDDASTAQQSLAHSSTKDDTLTIVGVAIGGVALLILIVSLILIAIGVRVARMNQKKGSQYKVDKDSTQQTEGFKSAKFTKPDGTHAPNAIPNLHQPTKPQDYIDMSRAVPAENVEISHQQGAFSGTLPRSGHYVNLTAPEDEEDQEIYLNVEPEASVYGNIKTVDGVYNNTR